MASSRQVRDQGSGPIHILLERRLRFLSAHQISIIDNILKEISPFGEVRMRVEKGELCFVAQTKSYDAFKLQRPEGEQEIGRGREP